MLLQEFRSGKAELMIGTQMIAKGLHFPEVTLVGVLNADASLNIPDFRAQEQVFQLITQVAGRAGRGFTPGEVIVQTLLPEHSTILHASKQDYEAFYKEECETRKLFDFPPYSKLTKFRFSGPDETVVQNVAHAYLETLKKYLPATFFCHPVLPSGHAKIKDQFRFQFLIRGPVSGPVQKAVEQTEKELKGTLPSSVLKSIDVDPSSIFF
jgi:primosomal protein N' (replication factor Y)